MGVLKAASQPLGVSQEFYFLRPRGAMNYGRGQGGGATELSPEVEKL